MRMPLPRPTRLSHRVASDSFLPRVHPLCSIPRHPPPPSLWDTPHPNPPVNAVELRPTMGLVLSPHPSSTRPCCPWPCAMARVLVLHRWRIARLYPTDPRWMSWLKRYDLETPCAGRRRPSTFSFATLPMRT